MSEDLKIRSIGVVLTGIGAALGWWLIVGPYRQALAGAPELEIHFKAFFFVPLILIFGVACVFFGEKLPLRGADEDRQRQAGYILAGIVAVISGLMWWVLKAQFAALGYA